MAETTTLDELLRESRIRRGAIEHCACPSCSNTVTHAHVGRDVWECQSCGTHSTHDQLREADGRINCR